MNKTNWGRVITEFLILLLAVYACAQGTVADVLTAILFMVFVIYLRLVWWSNDWRDEVDGQRPMDAIKIEGQGIEFPSDDRVQYGHLGIQDRRGFGRGKDNEGGPFNDPCPKGGNHEFTRNVSSDWHCAKCGEVE